MEYILPLLVIAAVIIAAYVQNAREDAKASVEFQRLDAMQEHQGENKNVEENDAGMLRTRDLFLDTLTKIGCQYDELSEGEGDDRIHFAYQGEHFMVNARNDWQYVQIWDAHWGHVELYDIEELSILKKAINASNLNTSVTTVYTIDEVGGNVDVHCKAVILFISQIPEIGNYLRMELGEFFRAHQYVGAEMARLHELEKSV